MISVKTSPDAQIFPAETGYMILLVKMDGYRPFWRRLRFPAHFTLYNLHQAIQAVTLFVDGHLHQFVDKRGHIYTPECYEELETTLPPQMCHIEQQTFVGAVLLKIGDKIRYCYDFGDGWEFSCKLEKWEPIPEGETPRITCVGGEKAGPVEDCGGSWEFKDLLKALAKPKPDQDDSDMQRQLPEDYDPDRFVLEEANRWLAEIDGDDCPGDEDEFGIES